MRENRQIADLLLSETQKAIAWVNRHPDESAAQCADIMGQPPEHIRRFLERVNFNYVAGVEFEQKASAYTDLLREAGLVKSSISARQLRLDEGEPSESLGRTREFPRNPTPETHQAEILHP